MTTNAIPTAYQPNVEGMSMTGNIPVVFEVSAVASGKRRNDVKAGMVLPKRLKVWDLASDEGHFHGGDESAPKPLAIFATGILTCFLTQMRTFAKPCGVNVQGLQAKASFEWTLVRDGMKPYVAQTGKMVFDIELDTDSSLEAQQLLVKAAARGCFAEACLRDAPVHRLLHRGEWIPCDVS